MFKRIAKVAWVSCAGVGVTLLLHAALWAWVQSEMLLILYVPAIILASWFAGVAGGIMTSLLAALLVTFFFAEPQFTLHLANPSQQFRIITFLPVSLLVVWLTASLRASRHLISAAEMARAATQSECDEILNSINEGFYSVNRDYRFTYVNRRTEQHFGKTASELLGMVIWDVVPQLRDTNAERQHRLALESQTAVEFATQSVVRKDRWIELRIYPTRSGLGVYFHDITERKNADEALRKSEERFRLAYQRAPIGIGHIALSDDRLLEVNDKLCEMLGYTREELLSRKCEQITHPEDRSAEQQLLVELTEKEVPFYVIEKRYVKSDGEPLWVRVTSAKVRGGAEPSRISIVEDISERKRTEVALHKTTEQLQQLQKVTEALSGSLTLAQIADVIVEEGIQVLGAASGSICQLSQDGTMMEIVRAKGYPEEVLRDWMRFPIDTPTPLSDAVKRRTPILLHNHEERDRAYPHLTATRLRTPSVAIAAIPLLSGQTPLGAMGLSFNEERLFTEQEFHFMLALARVCAEAIERARLYESEQHLRAEAERANRAKDEFLGVLSHELRTPLTPVLASIMMLERDPTVPPQLKADLKLIRRNVELEARIIDDLLDVTRITQGKLQLNLSAVDAHELLRQVLHTCEPEREAKSISLSWLLEASHAILHADPARLQQVFWNLIKNAIKFTPETGSINIRSWNHDNRLMIEVKDNGVGITPEVLPRLFRAFEQGGDHTTRQFGGLGLGLSISRSLVEQHHGHLTASSEGEGKGATFILELPLAENGASIPTLKPSSSPASITSAKRILLVEDNEDTREIMTRFLSLNGHEVISSSNIGEAISRVRSETFDLLVSDLGLPDGSGLDLMRQIRETSSLPAIALSGYGRESDITQTRDAGFSDHLVKPVDLDKLLLAIDRVLGVPAH